MYSLAGFRDLYKALAIYGLGSGGGLKPGDTPIRDKPALVDQLKQAIAEATTFCVEHGIRLNTIQAAVAFDWVKLLDDAMGATLVNDESKRRYLLLAGNVSKLHKAILPDPGVNELAPKCILLK